MAELNDWNVTAANNNSAPPNGWPENTMQYSEVNDTGREGMAVMKRYFADMNGSLTTTGAANAYLVTLNAGYTSYFAGMTFTVKIHADNTGASTINVNSIGVKSIVNGDGGAINAGQLKNGGLYRFSYDGTNFQLIGQGAYGALAQQDTINNSDWSGTDLAVANGGTGSSTAADARTALGLAIGSDVQAYDVHLTQIGNQTPADGNFFVGNGSAWVVESGATARTSLGLGSIATQNANSVAITGGAISGITDLAVADGGTGASDAGTARTNLGLAIGSDVQAYDADLTTIGGLAKTNGNFIVGNGSAWVAESGATARASLGLTIGTDVQAQDAVLDDLSALSVVTGADQFIVSTAAGAYSHFSKSATQSILEISRTSGTFTANWTGFTTSPSTTFYYEKVGNMVFVKPFGGVSATSNSSGFSSGATELPAALRPTDSVRFYVPVYDNGTTQLGSVNFNSGGSITFLADISNSSFQSTGQKGTIGGWTVAYHLNNGV